MYTPDILFGINSFLKLVHTDNIQQLPSGLSLVPSKLGILFGGSNEDHRLLSNSLSSDEVQLLSVLNMSPETTNLLIPPNKSAPVCFENWWRLQAENIYDDPVEGDDDKALQLFNSTVSFEQNRYQVSWLWNSLEENLPDNRDLAIKRFRVLINKKLVDKEILTAYDKVIKDQKDIQVVEPVPDENCVEGPLHYIPHQPVITPSRTTKLRIVYDASSKTDKHHLSFNDCLFRGPIDLPDLTGILMRFRLFLIAILSDIAKAFLQISLLPSERDCTRFFWLKQLDVPDLQASTNLQVLRFTRVLFGAKCSPSLLNLTVHHHLSKHKSEIAQKIKQNMYVDNCITGVNSVPEGIQFYKTAKQIFATASMNLREWATNSTELRKEIDQKDQAETKSLKVLGLCWENEQDTLSIKSFKTNFTETLTKRKLVEYVSSFFDPLGLVSPVLLGPKLLIQNIWRLILVWDEPIPIVFVGKRSTKINCGKNSNCGKKKHKNQPSMM